MTRFSKSIAGLVAASVLSLSMAAPAEARPHWRGYRHHDSTGEAIAGIAIIGGIAALIGAANQNRARYGSAWGYPGHRAGVEGAGYGYANDEREPYRAAVNSCGGEADYQYGQGSAHVTDVQRLDENYILVRGVIDRSAGTADGEDRPADNGRYYDGRYAAQPQAGFTCTALADGRIYDFTADRN